MILSEEILAIFVPVAGFFLLGALVIAVAAATLVGRETASELWAVYRSEFLIVGVLLVPAAIGVWAFTLLLLAFAWRGQVEMGALFELRGTNPAKIVAMGVAGLAIISPWFGYAENILPLILVGAGIMALAGVMAPSGLTRTNLFGALVAGLVFPVLCCVFAVFLRSPPEGFAWIFVVYATVEINDTFAFLSGKLIGTRRVFPKLSPGKTLEGLGAGIVTASIVGTYLAYHFLELSLVPAFLLTVLLIVAGISGDLATSALKRWRNKKDFSPVLEQHGGVLDIYDAFLFAAPAAFLFRWATAV